MSEQLPAPLVGAEVDLRGYGWMPLHGERLFRSDTWLGATDRERVACIYIWWAAWQQVPAGSLPDDDRVLAQLAGPGVALQAWRRMRARVMRGFVRCSDGRLYHALLCQEAIESWQRRENARARASLGGIAKAQRRRSTSIAVSTASSKEQARNKHCLGSTSALPIDIDSITNTVIAVDKPDSDTAFGGYDLEIVNPEPLATPNLQPAASLAIALRNLGVAVTSQHPRAIEWAEIGITIEQATEAVGLARIHILHGPIHPNYLHKILLRKREGPSEKIPWQDIDALARYGAEHGCVPQPGEDPRAYKARLGAELARQRRQDSERGDHDA